MWRIATLAALCVLLPTWLGARAVRAQVTVDGSQLAVTTSTSASAYQGVPAVAWEPGNTFVLAWQAQSAAAGGWDVMAQQYQLDADGTVSALGPAFQVSGPSSAFCRQFPAVAADAAGDFVVVWESNEEAAGTTGIYGQRYNGSAQAEGGLIHVNSTTSFNDQAPAVAMAPDGRFLVVWQRAGQSASGFAVVGQAFHADGTAMGGEIAVSQAAAGAQHSPAVAWLPASAAASEGWQVVFEVEGQDGGGAAASGIAGRVVDGGGNPAAGEQAINLPGTGAHAHPRIASDPSGNYAVAWENLTAAGTAVVFRRFNAAGAALSGQLAADGSPTGAGRDPAVAASATGELMVVWDELGQDGDGAAVVGQQFDNAEHPQGGKLQLNTTTAGDQALPGVAMTPGGSVLAVWQSQTPLADAAVIEAQAARLPALELYTIFPCRAVDTRNANGPFGGPALASGQVRTFDVAGNACGIPASAKALSINATVVAPANPGSVVLYPGDAGPPPTSSLSFAAGRTVIANNAIVSLSRAGDGSLAVLPTLPNGGHLHFLIDVNGYFQ
ncbi:MAG: hypothetical protein JOZ15_12040 [Acidobacteria bacterium]|nr:hypothetical protein [Acidobacteriota bacterium]